MCELNWEKISGLHVIWSVAPEAITHFVEEEIRHVLPDSARVVMEENSCQLILSYR